MTSGHQELITTRPEQNSLLPIIAGSGFSLQFFNPPITDWAHGHYKCLWALTGYASKSCLFLWTVGAVCTWKDDRFANWTPLERLYSSRLLFTTNISFSEWFWVQSHGCRPMYRQLVPQQAYVSYWTHRGWYFSHLQFSSVYWCDLRPSKPNMSSSGWADLQNF